MHQDVYAPGSSESGTCFGMPQVVSSGSQCMNYAFHKAYIHFPCVCLHYCNFLTASLAVCDEPSNVEFGRNYQ